VTEREKHQHFILEQHEIPSLPVKFSVRFGLSVNIFNCLTLFMKCNGTNKLNTLNENVIHSSCKRSLNFICQWTFLFNFIPVNFHNTLTLENISHIHIFFNIVISVKTKSIITQCLMINHWNKNVLVIERALSW
jgi:hypothetical protein